MRIYFMGIGGTAMGNAALLARAAGHEVLGADTGVYPPMSTVLARAGITFHEGYDPVRLEKLAPDLVVIGNAMSRGNPEVEWLLDTRDLPVTSLPALLHDFVLKGRRNLVIAGTHGKTTTTALTAFLLRANGRDPGFLIGGVPQDPPEGNHLGAAADPFVIEGDEYDSAFFDKRSKFIHYAPHIAVLNNLEFDHADIFRDLADVQRTFSHLTRIVPRNGWVVLNGDDDNLRALGPLPWTRVVRVGTGEANDTRIVDFAETAAGASFRLLWRGRLWAEVKWSQPGLFNARNAAMAATAAGLALALAPATPLTRQPIVDMLVGPEPATGRGQSAARPGEKVEHVDPNALAGAAGSESTLGSTRSTQEIQAKAVCNPMGDKSPGSATPATAANPTGLRLDALAAFRGVKRRQEILLATPTLTVIEDFGHHPTALAETLHSFRARFPGATLTAVFEPRSNTARTKALQAGFLRALASADEVYLGAVSRAEKLKDEERFDPEAVAQQLETQGVTARWFATNAALLAQLRAVTLPPPAGGPPRVVAFFTNGSFDGIICQYVAAAKGVA